MKQGCEHLAEFASVQREITLKNLASHKWLRHLPDTQTAKIDFVLEFGEIMRELYCGYICPDRHDCEIAVAHLPAQMEVTISESLAVRPCQRDVDLKTIKTTLLLKHLEQHKWFRQIADDETGKQDFLEKFGWMVEQMFCRYYCDQRFVCDQSLQFFLSV